MDYLQQLRTATPQIGGPNQPVLLQLQRAMGLLDSAIQYAGEQGHHQSDVFVQDVGRIRHELSLWAQALGATTTH